MKITQNVHKAGLTALALSMAASIVVQTNGAYALSTDPGSSAVRMNVIQKAATREIDRRIQALGAAKDKLVKMRHVDQSDKDALSAKATEEINDLTALKDALAAETTVDAVKADAKRTVTEYRVYALVLPKMQLVRVADDQLVVQDALNAVAPKLQNRIAAAKAKGKDVAALQTEQNKLVANVKAGRTLSTQIKDDLIALTPSDYNSNSKVLSDYRAQLQVARQDNKLGVSFAQNVAVGLAKLNK